MITLTSTHRNRSHFEILDGLRGVAAIMVVLFHSFEVYAHGNRFRQIINHGYLAVDFFFLLSGFVIAYAYDGRWEIPRGEKGALTLGAFVRRRLMRLQPMVILGNLLGAALFFFQRAPIYPLIASTTFWKLVLITLIGCTAIPALPFMDVRGYQEMFPLNGPVWSLFYEYFANMLYALGLRKLSRRALATLVFLFALLLLRLTVFGPEGDVIGGWALGRTQMSIGLTRMLFPFFAGILLMRLGKRIHLRGAFMACTLVLILSLSVPRLGGLHHLWMNGLYEAFCILIIFPILVATGAGSHAQSFASARLCKFLGDISYPLYLTHYPWVYLYAAWVTRYSIPAVYGVIMSPLLLIVTVATAFVCLKFYDEPIRARLANTRLKQSTSVAAVFSGRSA